MRSRIAFTLVELLAVISIIGVLAGLLLPAVQQSREAARRSQCLNNLRQLSQATFLFENTFRYFPPGRIAPRPGDPDELQCGGEESTWPVHILPYIEQSAMRGAWEPYAKWYDQPQALLEQPLTVFLCPSRRSSANSIGVRPISTQGGGGRLPCGCPIPGQMITKEVPGFMSDYAGNHGDLSPGAAGMSTDFYFGGNGTGVIITSRARCEDQMPVSWIDRLRVEDILDGTSNTFLFGERHVAITQLNEFPYDGPLYDGDHLPSSMRLAGPGLPLAQGPRDELSTYYAFGSWHPGVSQFALLDGSVRAISNSTDTTSLGQLSNRANQLVETISLE